MTDKVSCTVCGAEIIISKPTEGQLKSAAKRTRFCAECARKRKQESVKASYKKHKAPAMPNYDDRFPTAAEVDRGYKRFWEKRGIDINKITKWGSL